MTVDEYARLPDDGQRHELQCGLLVAEPRPLPRHSRIQARLGYYLCRFVEPRDLGVVLTEAGFLLARDPDTLRGPDVSFVRRGRYDPEKAGRAFFPGAPDLAVEILSPSNRPGETHARVADYLAAGTRLVWVVDPERREVLVYRTLLEPRRVGIDESLEGEDLLPGLSIAVADLLAD